MTRRHRGLKRKLRAVYRPPSRNQTCYTIMCRQSSFRLLIGAECKRHPIFHRRVWYRMLSLRYACIRSSSNILIPSATFVPNFVSFAAPIAELTCGEKSRSLLNQSINHSLTHPVHLIDAPATEAFALECVCICLTILFVPTFGHLDLEAYLYILLCNIPTCYRLTLNLANTKATVVFLRLSIFVLQCKNI